MIDFVLEEELTRFSKEFGFDKIIKINIIKAEDYEDLKKKINKEKIIVVEASKKLLRKLFENDKIDIILGLEKLEEKDNLHHRNSGLNQVLANLANKNKISIGFSFHEILNAKDRDKILGRIRQNVQICKKYKVNMVFGSFARDKYDLRLRKDLEAFGRLLGIDKLGNTKVCELPQQYIKVLD